MQLEAVYGRGGRAYGLAAAKTGVVYLKSTEFGMAYHDCTERENAKYRKSDFFIRCGSDNPIINATFAT
ncbi:hypothetical protein GOBAR_AA39792 [Gossypium barbadense]|uniref:Uncharacterized protein n=1 Tax=Gossypium barbadense TaxID=3634 RepID=A0A2P5VQ07_GOSBA|nr:hypothetical protein GOBAR_AA39792 [Gossypium barbadense]